MKRLLILLGAAVLVLALAAPAMAVRDNPGPPEMMVGSHYRYSEFGPIGNPDSWFEDRMVFKASGTLEDGQGFIRWERKRSDGQTEYREFEVTSFYRRSDTQAACYAQMVASSVPGLPVEHYQMVLWVEDNGQGPMAEEPDGFFWTVNPLVGVYSPEWITEWLWDDFLSEDLLDVEAYLASIDSGNIVVH